MVGHNLKCLIILLFAALTVKCETCVTYDFGANFESTFNNGTSVCNGMATWTLGDYSSFDIESLHPETEMFIKPDEILSCVSSYSFEMMSNGTLEAYVYMESTSPGDQIVVLANEISTSGRNVVTGTAMLTPLSATYFNGWHVLRINLFGTGIFNGYVSIFNNSCCFSVSINDISFGLLRYYIRLKHYRRYLCSIETKYT